MITAKETEIVSLARKTLDDRGDIYGDVISVRQSQPKNMSLRKPGWVVGFRFEALDSPPGSVMDPAYFYVEVYENGRVLVPSVS